MRVVIAGSRSYHSVELVDLAVRRSEFTVAEVVEGGAIGTDRAARQWAEAKGIPVTTVPAAWRTHGKMAGPIRNTKMAYDGDALIAIWDGVSAGTYDMITKMKAEGKPTFVLLADDLSPAERESLGINR